MNYTNKDTFIDKLINASLSSKISWKRLNREIISPFFFENEFVSINYSMSYYCVVDKVSIFLISVTSESGRDGSISEDIQLSILTNGSQELQVIDTNSTLLFQLLNAVKYCIGKSSGQSAAEFMEDFLKKY